MMQASKIFTNIFVFPEYQMTKYIHSYVKWFFHAEKMCKRIPKQSLMEKYTLTFPEWKRDDHIHNARHLGERFAEAHSFMSHKGVFDVSRSARILIKDYINGILLYCYPPPTMQIDQTELEHKSDRCMSSLTLNSSVSEPTLPGKKHFKAFKHKKARNRFAHLDTMLANTAHRMLQELYTSTQDGVLPDYDTESIPEIIRECRSFYDLNQRDLSEITDLSDSSEKALAVQLRHHALLRNRRCLMAYFFKRIELIQQLRLDFGTVLPSHVRSRLSPSEQEF